MERRDSTNPNVDVLRPFFQGDVFVGVPLHDVPGTGEPSPADLAAAPGVADAVMLIGHPCSMVNGAVLLPYQEVVRVRTTPLLHYDLYGSTRYEEFPLPFLDTDNPDRHYSACLHEHALVDTGRLDRANRVAALSLEGVLALQQRLTHESSRVRVEDRLLRQATWPRWQEVDLASEWNDRVLRKQNLTGAELLAALAEEAAAFDEAVGTKLKYKDEHTGYTWTSTLRAEMFDQGNQGRVKTAVTVLAKKRNTVLSERRQQQKVARDREAKVAQIVPLVLRVVSDFVVVG